MALLLYNQSLELVFDWVSQTDTERPISFHQHRQLKGYNIIAPDAMSYDA
jgi:hypothetical protein